LCVVVASVVQDEEAVEWSEVSALIWPVQPRLWFMLQWQRITRLITVFVLCAIAAWDRITEEMEKYESLRYREFAHTHVYDVNLLERVGLDAELPTILQTIGSGKLYDEPRLGSCLLTLEFVMTFETV
jgi:hypothetical protein